MLGPIALEDGPPIKSTRQRLLLAVFALHADRVVSSDRLVDELWGDDLPADPPAALRTQLARLRRRLPEGALVTEERGYRLRAEPEELDSVVFEQLFAAGRVDEALSLWRGPAFDEFADRPAFEGEAFRLDELRLVALERQAASHLARGSAAEAAALGQALLAEHPERERARAIVMDALYRDGRQIEALATYQSWRRQLAEEKGLEPAPELARLETQILQHRLVPSRLPRPISSFVGRDGEIRAVVERLVTSRLVTLSGPGGVGKTRLAVSVASATAAEYPDGVCFCDLVAATRTTHVARSVAAAVGYAEHAGRPLVDQLVDHLADRQVLLVLDNCEHVLDGVARVAELLVQSGSAVRVLATSRERLAIDGEQVVTVAPLEREAAVTLFRDRARALDPSFNATADEIAAICARLDCLPLAVELAAARAGALGVDGLSTALDDGLGILSGGARTTSRHRSLTAVVDWSYEQLADDEKAGFGQLAVFAGRFRLEDAEGVGVPPRVVAALVDRSLVEGRGHYRLLDTLRAYGIERLRARYELGEARDRHARWVVATAERAAKALAGPREPAWSSRLADLIDELRSAHAWLVGQAPALAVRLSDALHPWAFWRTHSEAFRWAEVVAGTTADAAALASAAAGAWQRGDLDAAEAAARAALPHRRAVEALADVAFMRGDLARASALFEQAAVAAESEGDVLQIVWDRASMILAAAYGGQSPSGIRELMGVAEASGSFSARAMAHFVAGEVEGDSSHLEEAVALARVAGTRLVAGIAEVSLAALAARQDEADVALRRYATAISGWAESGAWTPQWVTLRSLTSLLTRLGAADDAALLYGAAVSPRTGPTPFGEDASRLEEVAADLRRQLGDDAFAARAATGAALDDVQVLAAALSAVRRLGASPSAEAMRLAKL